jgi:hypothetical protein
MVIFNSYVKLPEGIGAKDIESTETWPVLTRIYHCEVQRPSDLTDLRNLKQGGILTARIGCSKAKASQKQGRSQEHDAPHDMNDTVPVLFGQSGQSQRFEPNGPMHPEIWQAGWGQAVK